MMQSQRGHYMIIAWRGKKSNLHHGLLTEVLLYPGFILYLNACERSLLQFRQPTDSNSGCYWIAIQYIQTNQADAE